MVANSHAIGQHGAMLLVHDLDGEGQERIIVLPVGAIVSYFTADAIGIVLHVEPGLYTDPSQFSAQCDSVRTAILAEVSRRLLIRPEDVAHQSMSRLKEIADTNPVVRSAHLVRKRSKGLRGLFSR